MADHARHSAHGTWWAGISCRHLCVNAAAQRLSGKSFHGGLGAASTRLRGKLPTSDHVRMASIGSAIGPWSDDLQRLHCRSRQRPFRIEARCQPIRRLNLIALRAMHETGLAEYGQFLAHGIGMGHHEAPRLAGENQTLRPGGSKRPFSRVRLHSSGIGTSDRGRRCHH